MPKDCVILVADLDTENAIKGLLSRPQKIRCRPFNYDIFRHPQHDPGVRSKGGEFIDALAGPYEHALLILDRHGSGADDRTAEQIESDIENRLPPRWRPVTAAVVIDPEVEAWVWSDSPSVEQVLGWHGRVPSLRNWLAMEGHWQSDEVKPRDPKTAFRQALRTAQKTNSAALFKQLGGTVGTQRCTDRAFRKLVSCLSSWFAAIP